MARALGERRSRPCCSECTCARTPNPSRPRFRSLPPEPVTQRRNHCPDDGVCQGPNVITWARKVDSVPDAEGWQGGEA